MAEKMKCSENVAKGQGYYKHTPNNIAGSSLETY